MMMTFDNKTLLTNERETTRLGRRTSSILRFFRFQKRDSRNRIQNWDVTTILITYRTKYRSVRISKNHTHSLYTHSIHSILYTIHDSIRFTTSLYTIHDSIRSTTLYDPRRLSIPNTLYTIHDSIQSTTSLYTLYTLYDPRLSLLLYYTIHDSLLYNLSRSIVVCMRWDDDIDIEIVYTIEQQHRCDDVVWSFLEKNEFLD